ncbi:MAG: hypothetical protein KAT32_01225 [Candidatus Moranbacteria bacterium]|nr:hypothetical protein [Candidatus Moranbacteria bacterium]
MKIIPTILTDDSDKALEQIEALRGVADWLQIDVMDGTMTDSSTFDLYDLVGEVNDFQIEVHLMVNNPEEYFDACETLAAERVYFHLESVESPSFILEKMEYFSFERGMVLSPQTDVDSIIPYIDDIQAIQIMTVAPGKQGQSFIPEMLDKVRELKKDYSDKWVSVDGGVNEGNLKEVQDSGVDAAGVGSAVMGVSDIAGAYEDLVKMAG